MQVDYDKNGYKDYDNNDTTNLNYDYSDLEFHTDVVNSDELMPSLACFNRHSITLKNFRGFSLNENNYIFKTFTEAENIEHTKKLQRDAKELLKLDLEKTTLEDHFNPFNHLIKSFNDWLDKYKKYPMFAQYHDDNNNPEYFKLENRFISNRNIYDLSDALHNYKGKGIFLTLTYNHNNDLFTAWANVSHDWDLFLNRLVIELNNNPYKSKPYFTFEKHYIPFELDYKIRKIDLTKYPVKKTFKTFKLDFYKGKIYPSYPKLKRSDLQYIRVLEAQKNGYPHIHALFLNLDFLYYAGNKIEFENDNAHSKNLKHFWGRGSIFINKTNKNKNVEKPLNYMMKYIRKTFNKDGYGSVLTQALIWAFNKRSFDTSEYLKNFLNIKPHIPCFSLDGIITFEKLTGQKTPMVWLEKINKTVNSQSELKHEYVELLINRYELDPAYNLYRKIKPCRKPIIKHIKHKSKFQNPLHYKLMDLSIFLWDNIEYNLLIDIEFNHLKT